MRKLQGPYVLGSDIGTSGCKSVVLDAGGIVAGWALQSYPTLSLFPGWAEQNPSDWFNAFCNTTRHAIQKAEISPEEIVCVCIVGITHNAVLLDIHDRVIRPSIVYTDIRSIAQSNFLRKEWGERIFNQTWNSMDPLWTWPQLLWIQENEPEHWRQVKRILFPKDYVRHQIAPSFLSDPIDPVGTLLYNPVENHWISEFINNLDLPETAFPQIEPVTQVAGGVTQRASQMTGLRPGTPVITGTTDTAAEMFGAGALRKGQFVVKLSTVGRIMAISHKPLPNPIFLNYPHVLPGLWYPGSSTKFAASAFSWAREALWNEPGEAYSYEAMDKIAGQVSPGSGGVLFHPYLAGEFAPLWDPYLRANFLGIGREHTRAHFTRAVMEGVAFALRHALESMMATGLQLTEVRLIGGGAVSRLWPQIMADILSREILVPADTDAAFGAALLAGVAAGFFKDEPGEVSKFIRFRSHHCPQPANEGLYSHLFNIYREAAATVQDISHKLHQFQTDYQLIGSENTELMEALS